MPRLSQEIRFANKIITKDDLVKLVNLFSDLIVSGRKSNLYSELQRIKVLTKTVDGVDYSFNESELKNLSSHFQQKKLESLSISYSDNKTNNELNFRLGTNAYSTNYFQISSDREAWLNNNIAHINDFLSSLKPQENFYIANRRWIRPIAQFLLATPLTYIAFVVLVFILSSFIPPSPVRLDDSQKALGRFYVYLFMIFINLIIGETFVSRLFKHLDSLWPSIELITGPEHSNKLRERRKSWMVVSQIVIIPFIISLFFYLIGGIKPF